MRLSRRKCVAVTGVALLAISLFLVTSSPFQQWLLRRAEDYADKQGFPFTAKRLHLEWTRLKISVDGFAYDRNGQSIRIEHIAADFPWDALRNGDLRITDFEVAGVAVTLQPSENKDSISEFHLPSFSSRLRIDHLAIRNASLMYSAPAAAVNIPSVSIEVTNGHGILRLDTPASYDTKAEFNISPIPLELGVDGVRFGLGKWKLQYAGHNGSGSIRGVVHWSPGFALETNVATDPITIEQWKNIKVSARVSYRDGIWELPEFRVTQNKYGEVSGSAKMSGAETSANVTWTNLSLDPLGVSARLDGSLKAKWPTANLSAISADGQARMKGPQLGDFQTTFQVINREAVIDIRAHSSDLDVRARVDTGLEQALAGNVTEFRGTMHGTIQPLSEVSRHTIGSVDISASGILRGNTLALKSIRAKSGESTISNATLQVKLDSKRIRGTIPQARIALQDFAPEVKGTVELAADIGGSLLRPAATFTCSSGGLQFGGVLAENVTLSGAFVKNSPGLGEAHGVLAGLVHPLSSGNEPYFQGFTSVALSAGVHLRDDTLWVKEIHAKSNASTIDDAELQLNLTDRRIQGVIPQARIDFRDLDPNVTGSLNLSANIDGTIAEPSGSFFGISTGFDFGKTHIDSVELNGTLTKDSVVLGRFEARQLDGRLNAEGALNLATEQFHATAEVSNLLVDELTDLSGTVFMKAKADGNYRSPNVIFDGEIRNAVYRNYDHGTVHVEGMTNLKDATVLAKSEKYNATVDGKVTIKPPYVFSAQITSSQSRIHYDKYDVVTDGRLKISGEARPFQAKQVEFEKFELKGKGVEISANGPMETGTQLDLGADLSKIPIPVEGLRLGGTAQAHATLSGALDNPSIEGTLTTNRATVRAGKMSEDANVSAAVDFTGHEFSIRDVHASYAGATATITGHGSWQGAGQVQFQIANIRPENFMTGRPISGIASIEGKIEFPRPSLDEITGSMRFTELDLTARDIAVNQKEPIEVDLDHRIVTIRHFNVEGPETQASLSGYANLGTHALNVDVDADTDLAIIEPLIPDLHPSGRIRSQIAVRGTPQNPSFDGFVNVSDGEIALETPNLHLERVHVESKLSGNRIDISQASGVMNDGTFEATGGTNFSHSGLSNAEFDLKVERGRLDYPEGLQSEFSTQVKISGTSPSLMVSGNIDVLSASYEKDFKLTQEMLKRITSTRPIATPAAASVSGFGDQIRLELEVGAPGTILVKNNVADLEATGTFRIRGTASNPIVLGRAAVLDGGELYFGPAASIESVQKARRSDRYTIERGSIDFNNPLRSEPDLDFEAKHELDVKDEHYLITLNVSGTPETLKAELTSDPYLEQSDIVAMLLTGRSYADLQGSYASYAGELALGYVTGQLSERWLSQAGSVVGLSSVSIEPVTIANQTDLAARLNIARDITKGFSLIYSQNLNGSMAQTWIVSYGTKNNLVIRGINDADANEVRAEIKQDLQLGGGITSKKPTPTPAATKLRNVTFSGTRISDKDLLNQVAKRGSPYSVYRANEDIRKLRRYLATQGYPRARIQAHQNVVNQRVDVRFEIVEGPRIQLEYDGASVPANLRTEVQQVFSLRSSDASALKECTKRLLSHFRSEGYLQAQISTENRSFSSEDRRYVFNIDSAHRFDAPVWVFNGAEPMDITDPAGVVMESPKAFKDRIELFYRGQGFLDTTSTVPKLVIDKGKAHFEVTVDRGMPYFVKATVFDGNHAIDDTRLREVITSGTSKQSQTSSARFTSEWLEAARQSVTSEYWRNGFNDVQVVPTVISDPASARATVRFAITEGEPQRIESIDISGASHTSTSYIQHQFQFKAGDPVDYTKVNLTRKKLYDTQVFRRVEIEMKPGQTGYKALVRLTENPPWQLHYGFSLNHQLQTGEDRIGLAAAFWHNNLFGRGITAGVSSNLDSLERNANIFASQQQSFGRNVATTVTLFLIRDLSDPEELSDYRGVTIQQRWRLANHYLFSYDYSYRHVRTTTTSNIGSPNTRRFRDSFLDNPTIPIARLNTTISRETRNDLLNATRGIFFSNSFEIAPPGIGSSLVFLRNYTQYYFLHPFKKRFVSASAVRFGLARSLDSKELDSILQFRAGGSTTVRAFKQDELTEFPGNYVLVLNQEVRYPLFWKFSGAAFIDAGQVTNRPENLWHLRFGPGAGIRISTPIVLVRTDFGINVKPRLGESRVRLSFGIGQVF